MSALASAGVPELHLSADGWQVEVVEREPGLTRVTRDGHDLHVRVGDGLPEGVGRPLSRRLRSLIVADLSADGSVHLVTRCSPPALVVTRSGAELLPPDGLPSARRWLETDDLLVMCSASTLDAHPSGVVALLKAGPERVRHIVPEQLVRELVRGSLTGAAVVARRL